MKVARPALRGREVREGFLLPDQQRSDYPVQVPGILKEGDRMGQRSRAKAARRQPPKPRGTQVRINGIDWYVDSAPLTGTGSANHRTTRVARHTADVFVLAPSWSTYIFGVVLTISSSSIGLASVVGVVNWVWNGFPAPARTDPGGLWFLFAVIAAVFLWFGVRGVTRNTMFDRITGRMTRRVLWQTTVDRPVTDIIVVQCLYAGLKSSGGPRGGTSWHEYQLNLAVTDGPGVRVKVCSEPNGLWVRATATALAKFLGVPVVDHFAATGAPCDQPRTGVWHWLWNWKRWRK